MSNRLHETLRTMGLVVFIVAFLALFVAYTIVFTDIFKFLLLTTQPWISWNSTWEGIVGLHAVVVAISVVKHQSEAVLRIFPFLKSN